MGGIVFSMLARLVCVSLSPSLSLSLSLKNAKFNEGERKIWDQQTRGSNHFIAMMQNNKKKTLGMVQGSRVKDQGSEQEKGGKREPYSPFVAPQTDLHVNEMGQERT